MLIAKNTTINGGVKQINIVKANNKFFFHQQIEFKKGKLFMRAKKRLLL